MQARYYNYKHMTLKPLKIAQKGNKRIYFIVVVDLRGTMVQRIGIFRDKYFLNLVFI
jgi:hypothetical protein